MLHKRLKFGTGLFEPTIIGVKHITLRKYHEGSHDFTKNQVVRGEFEDGYVLLLEMTADTEKKPFSKLTDKEAVEDGFEYARTAFNGLKRFYPDLKKSDLCAIVRYRILEIGGEPVFGLLQN